MIIEVHHHMPDKKEVLLPVLEAVKKGGFDYQVLTLLYYPPFAKDFFQDLLIFAYRK